MRRRFCRALEQLVCSPIHHFSDGRGGSAPGAIQGDLGADRTIMATTAVGDDDVTVPYIDNRLQEMFL